MITALAGGVGAAKLLAGLVRVMEPADLTVIANTGDDTVMHGLHISPDIDTIVYTLAGASNPETGWGLAGETFRAMESLDRYGGPTWFRLGDADLATHLFRSGHLGAGASLSDVTAMIARAWGLSFTLLPMSDAPVATMVTLRESGEEVPFQDYFVRLHHAVDVQSLRFQGATASIPAPGVLEAIAAAETIVVCPSNPLVSIGPILGVPGIGEALAARRHRTVAVSPLVAGAALKGPADRMMTELGLEASVVGVARLYAPYASVLVIDEADRDLQVEVEKEGLRCLVTRTVMENLAITTALAREILGAAGA